MSQPMNRVAKTTAKPRPKKKSAIAAAEENFEGTLKYLLHQYRDEKSRLKNLEARIEELEGRIVELKDEREESRGFRNAAQEVVDVAKKITGFGEEVGWKTFGGAIDELRDAVEEHAAAEADWDRVKLPD